MKTLPGLLIVSGLGRNIGKTELATRLIEHQSRKRSVFGVKVSVIRPDTSKMIAHVPRRHYQIYEETSLESAKDTSRMLRSGATKVYYIQAEPDDVSKAFTELLQRIPANAPIVCESNSLGDFFIPGLHLLIAGKEHRPDQYKAKREKADLCLISDRKSGFDHLDSILYADNRWQLRASHSSHQP